MTLSNFRSTGILRYAPALLLAFGSAVAAQADYIPTYSITNNETGPITDMVLFWADPQGGIGSLNGLGEPGINAPGMGQTTVIQDLPKPRVPAGLFVLGLYQETAADPVPGQEHVVLFMNSYAASLTANIAWGTIFRHTFEDQLVADLHAMTATEDSGAINDIFAFASGDATTIPDLHSPTGTVSSWITPSGSGTPSSGKIMMWSSGTEIGSFSASVQSTPEPASMAALGLGVVALIRRKKK